MFIWYFRARKLLISVNRVSRYCCFSVFDFIRQITIRTAQQWRIIDACFLTSDRHRKLNQLRWQNMSAHLTNRTSYWLKKLLMHLNWVIYTVCDLNIDPLVCFFPTLSHDRARPIPLAQPEACPQRSERPVCARSPHRSRNGYPGWCKCFLLIGFYYWGAGTRDIRWIPLKNTSAARSLFETKQAVELIVVLPVIYGHVQCNVWVAIYCRM